MAQAGHDMVVPTVPVADADMPRLPWIDPENVNSGYIMRALHLLPRQGDRHPWKQGLEYEEERVSFPRHGPTKRPWPTAEHPARWRPLIPEQRKSFHVSIPI